MIARLILSDSGTTLERFLRCVKVGKRETSQRGAYLYISSFLLAIRKWVSFSAYQESASAGARLNASL